MVVLEASLATCVGRSISVRHSPISYLSREIVNSRVWLFIKEIFMSKTENKTLKSESTESTNESPNSVKDLSELGFDENLDGILKSLKEPSGLILVTGLSGSGRTTTLYSMLQELRNDSRKIFTIEEPIHKRIDGINQTELEGGDGLHYSAAIENALKQDTDVIFIGEIRNLETAEMAIKASLSGHLVISSLQTKSAPDTIARLLNMGVSETNLSQALTCVINQKLLNRICDRCREVDKKVTPAHLAKFGFKKEHLKNINAYIGEGCDACDQTGVGGHIAIHEFIKISEPMRNAIRNSWPLEDINRVAVENGMRTLRQSGLDRLAQGIVSIYEVL